MAHSERMEAHRVGLRFSLESRLRTILGICTILSTLKVTATYTASVKLAKTCAVKKYLLGCGSGTTETLL